MLEYIYYRKVSNKKKMVDWSDEFSMCFLKGKKCFS